MKKWLFYAIGLMAAYSVTCIADGFTLRRVQDDSIVGNYRWILETSSGVRFQLVQRIPDQTRSFYNARGFTLAAADEYASACVLQTIVNNNTAGKVITFDLANWRVIYNGQERPLKLTPDWQKQWAKHDLPESARIAFQWSQFPNVQKHGPGDWFQGMIAAELPPTSVFDLKIIWSEDDVAHTATMAGIQCAEDRNLGAKQ